MEILAYILIGILTGIMSGLLGIGGGVIMVPALVVIFNWQGLPQHYLMQIVTATSLTAIIMTTFMAAWSHHKRGAVQWSLLKTFIPGTVIGALIGVWIAKQISTHHLQIAFAVFAILLGLRLIWGAHKKDKVVKSTPHPLVLLLLASLVGILSGMLGLGGGVLLVPIFLWLGVAMVQASATSAACAFPTALSGSIMAMIAGWHISGLPAMCFGFVYLPAALILGLASLVGAPLGVALAHRLPVPIVKRIFGVVLLLIAGRMMLN